MHHLVSIIFALILTNSCSKSEHNNCTSEKVQSSSIDIDFNCNINIVNNKDEDNHVIINSIEDLHKNVYLDPSGSSIECKNLLDELSGIDYQKFTLLIGKKVVNKIQPTLISQNLERSCINQSITLNIKIKNGGYTAIGVYKYALVIPKHTKDVKYNIDVSD